MSADPELGAARRSVRQLAHPIRLVMLAIALVLIFLGLADESALGGGEGFGWAQAALVAVGIAVLALALAPLAWSARGLALLISLGLTLTAAELVLRRALGPRYYTSIQLDERTLYRLNPGTQREYTRAPINGGLRIRYGINSAGFRGEELAPPGTLPRVVVYGDSFIQAEFSRTEDTFADRLEAHLARRLGKPVEVVNAGVAGYGPDQELRRMETELVSLRPQLVVVAIYAGNDFGDVLRNKLYRLQTDGSLRDNAYAVDETVKRRVAVAQSELILKKVLRDALRGMHGDAHAGIRTGSVARRERVEAALAQLEAEYREYVVEGDDTVHELMSDPYNADVSLTPQSASAKYRIAMLDQIVERMRATAQAERVPLLLVLIPSPIDVSDEHESGEVDVVRHPEYRRSALTDALKEICERHGVPVVNLFEPFSARGARELYLKGVDDHWNEPGQDFAAELVSDFVVARDLLAVHGGGSP